MLPYHVAIACPQIDADSQQDSLKTNRLEAGPTYPVYINLKLGFGFEFIRMGEAGRGYHHRPYTKEHCAERDTELDRKKG